MNEENFDSLEKLLRGVNLRQPSAELDKRIVAIARADRPRVRRWRLALAAAAGASITAAGLVLVMLWPKTELGPQPSSVPVAKRQPVQHIERVWSSLAAKDVVAPGSAAAVCRIERRTVRDVQWIDPENHVRMQWQETVSVPVEYN